MMRGQFNIAKCAAAALAVVFFLAVFIPGVPVVHAKKTSVSTTQIKIVIREASQVNRSDILLGDIADIHAADFLKEALSKIEVCPSPRLEKIKLLDNKKIVSAIQGQQYLTDDIKIMIPEHVYVKRLSQKISQEDVQTILIPVLSGIFKDQDFNLVSLKVRGLELYPQGKVDLILSSNDIIGPNGKLSVFLDVNINGKKYDRLSVTGQVELFENVLCVKRLFRRGEKLGKDDVYFKKLNIYDLSDDYIRDVDRVENKILTTGLRKGEYLRAGFIEKAPLVRKGDIVSLISKNESLLIMASGISKEDGLENELIRVENLSSGKLVQGIVKGKTKVEVRF